jgi:hypothetical protein
LTHRVEHVFGQAALLEDGAHQREERNRQQQFVGQDAEDVERQRRHERGREPAHVHREEAAAQPECGKREGDREADQQRDDEPREHQRGEGVHRHCSGFS